MLCPYCSSPLQDAFVMTKSDQQGLVHECFTCGGHWFPRWLANDIASAQAINTDSITPQTQVTAPQSPRCPECHTRLSLIKHDSVRKGLHIYSCPEGHGNYFPKGELIQFKKAQEAKITYHQVWGVPIKSVLAVLLPVIVFIAVAASIPLTTLQVEKSTESRIKASDVISIPTITNIPPDSVALSFITNVTGTTTITLYQNDQPVNTYTASTTPSTVHTTTIKNLTPAITYTYTITLKTPTDTITSQSFPLVLRP